VDHGGLVFYGGFIAALLAIYVFAKRQKLSFLKVLDIVAPGTALAHAFGRIGCFLNGCCFGKESKMHWAVVFPQNSDPYKYYGKLVSIHPTQLYESCANLLIFIVLFVLVRKMKKGRTTFLYLILYGTARFIIEFFRGDHKSFVLGVLTPAQFIGIFVIVAGAAGFIYLGVGDEKPKNEANE
jgi:phosphatidylglycerol:prolipoprotein diacylglycerol transferase